MINRILMFLFEFIRVPVLAYWYLSGWRVVGPIPDLDKFVAIAVPHTTMWDYWHFLIFTMTGRRRTFVTMKKELFFFPMNIVFSLLGAIPIDRHKSANLIDQIVEKMNQRQRMIMVFTAEGSRSYTEYWKTGFYFTALKANVPIACGYVDYKHKLAGIGLLLTPTGNLEADFEKIRAFYQEKGRNGMYPEKVSRIALKSEVDSESAK